MQNEEGCACVLDKKLLSLHKCILCLCLCLVAACSSSLVATHLAVNALSSGQTRCVGGNVCSIPLSNACCFELLIVWKNSPNAALVCTISMTTVYGMLPTLLQVCTQCGRQPRPAPRHDSHVSGEALHVKLSSASKGSAVGLLKRLTLSTLQSFTTPSI